MILALLASATVSTCQDSMFADRATAELVALARRRHAAQDTLVRDYQATVRSRLDVQFGRSRFGRLFPLLAAENLARIQWAYPNDVKVDLVAQRGRALLTDIRADVRFRRPWFIARGLGDSIRLIEDGEIPERAALHPFAPGAESYYRYAIADSLGIRLPERLLTAVGIDVEPTRLAPSLVAGRIWVDRASGDVVRFTFFFLGEYLWAEPEGETPIDSAKARDDNRTATKALRVEADIEYALFEQRFWMPYTQLVTIQVYDPWITGAALPVRFVTTFSDYRINTGEAIEFTLDLPEDVTETANVDSSEADGAQVRAGRRRGGGRWEVTSPSRDSLLAYAAWPDSMEFAAEPEDERRFREVTEELAGVAEQLPGPWVGRGGVTPTQFGELFRFNRIQGVSFGGAYAWEPGIRFTRVILRARYGLTDGRFLPEVVVRRDAPSGLWEVGGGRALRDVDPFSNGGSLANSVNALFTGHDDADYLLAVGGRVTRRGLAGRTVEWSAHLGVEDQRSVGGHAESVVHDLFFGDGVFPPNPPVRDGVYGIGGLQLDSRGRWGWWRLGVDGLGDDSLIAARAWGEASRWLGPLRIGAAAGAASRDDVPQALLRAGGPRTVRGYDFGSRTGEALWALQLELMPRPGRVVSPVFFADAGTAGEFDDVLRDTPLMGVGAGVSFSLLVTELRLAVSKSIGAYNDGPVRFDLLFRPVR